MFDLEKFRKGKWAISCNNAGEVLGLINYLYKIGYCSESFRDSFYTQPFDPKGRAYPICFFHHPTQEGDSLKWISIVGLRSDETHTPFIDLVQINIERNQLSELLGA